MKKDFTLDIYKKLIQSFKNRGYEILTYEDYLKNEKNHKRFVILRHDIDKLPNNALRMAELENELNVKSTYYFRIVSKSNKPKIIKKIASYGHEIGYHYEDLTLAKGDSKKAIELFKRNLAYFRQFYNVKTIAYHGSPITKWSNQDIWEKYDYKDYKILGEPFFDINFKKVLYLTDTGRSWNGRNFSVRDKVKLKSTNKTYNTSYDLLTSLEKNRLNNKIHLNVHSQRWHNNPYSWLWELIFQNIKNVIKKYFFVK